jgi:pimeloyl-ACP methyl ester carboxylesterase
MKTTPYRVRTVLGGLALAGLGLAAGVVAWHSPGKTAPILGPDGRPLPNSIAQLEAVEINGTTQWLLIRGHDRTKPVLLFLHGGPGLPELSLLVGHQLEKQFVVVNWEQRGAGKSYDAAVFDERFTIDTFVEDAAEVSRLLARRFPQAGSDAGKLVLMAHSWGTFLGILLVKKYPELFRAYLSISQIVNQLEAEQISYDWVLQQAQTRGAHWQVRRLLKQGRPPYPPKAWLSYLTWQRKLVADYGGAMHNGNFYSTFIPSILLCREYTLLDKLHYAPGAMKTVDRLWPAVVDTDLFRLAPTLDVPYFLFQGEHDYQTPYRLARRYFEQVKAPQKELFTFAKSAHSPIFEEPDRFMQYLQHSLQSVAPDRFLT